ncbi:hypothetical protein Tsubulata_016245 [Turnera subulata]|uniref:cysteine--tRNA ligase n=1 Tax=Turnera subulata TaxID=218843 RepID=A0A9Q0GGU3_9ROSI|nr:hypothetical protein Tsubulata_016245 [Turnera subulata]
MASIVRSKPVMFILFVQLCLALLSPALANSSGIGAKGFGLPGKIANVKVILNGGQHVRVDVSARFPGTVQAALTETRRGLSELVLEPLREEQYYEIREPFSIMSVVKSPMGLMMGFMLVVVFLMPKLVENMDPEEMRRAQEEMRNQGLDMDSLPTTTTAAAAAASATKSERRWRSKNLQNSKPSLVMAFFSCVAWLYVAGRLWQDAENRTLLSNLLKMNAANRPKVLTVEDKLTVLGCKDLERRIVETEMELTLAKSQGYLKNQLQKKGSSSDQRLLAVIGVYTGFGSHLKRNEGHEEAQEELPKKVKFFFSTAVQNWDAEFYGLIGLLERRRGQDSTYMGCMKSGDVITEEGRQWYEPEWWKFGDDKSYFRHAGSSIFILSKNLAQYININSASLKIYAHDDVSVGSWMMGIQATYRAAANMGTLLKCYKPLSSIRFLPPPNSLQCLIQIPTPSPPLNFLISRRRRLHRLFTSLSTSSSSSPTSISDESFRKTNGGDGTATPLPAELWLYNTMSRKRELFKPKVEGKVGMYVCGVTAYDLSHIGHARVYVTFDVLYRYLRHLGYEVSYVRNFTDVDDKIIARANELGEDPIALSRRYCEEFLHDMELLHCLLPSVQPRVSDHMPQIIDMIKRILDNGCAYAVDGDVYFSVDKFRDYGQLSGRKLEDNRAGERVAVDSRKKNPADFALWKSAKEGEPFWESPWGPGRPGWHIECSAMSAAYLGYSFDIHGGGVDLVFPHHENEIAQSCAACRDSNISYWVHNGFVTIDSEKMSKSLGNFFTIRQVIDLYHPLALRLFLLTTHYRSPLNYSDVQLESASERIFYIYQTLHDCENVVSQHNMTIEKDSVPSDTMDTVNKFHDIFCDSMSDDLHASVVLSALSDPLKIINDILHTRKGRKQAKRIESIAALEKIVRKALIVLGLMPTTYFEALQQLREKALRRAKLTEDQILQKIEERTLARKNKEYEKSDAIRKDLAAVGIALMDSPDGTNWRPAVPLGLQEQQVAPT